jgi:membrane associated rhomboid family serine protease
MQQLKQFFSSTTNRIVAVTVLVYVVLEAVYPNSLSGFELYPSQSGQFKIWQLFSHMFLHGSVTHLAFNMIGLWSFGRVLERVWGGQRFLYFYLICGVCAGIAQLIVTEPYSVAVGASGALYGVLVAFALLFPNFKIMLIFLPVPIPAKYFVPVLLLIDLSAGLTGIAIFGQNIAHFAHLGGAMAGFVLVKTWLKS